MAKMTNEQLKAALAEVERRLRAEEKLSNHDFETQIKAAGSSHKGAQKLITKHGSPYLISKYAESFGNQSHPS